MSRFIKRVVLVLKTRHYFRSNFCFNMKLETFFKHTFLLFSSFMRAHGQAMNEYRAVKCRRKWLLTEARASVAP